MIAKVVSSRLATMRDLDEALGVCDLYDLAEIIDVDTYNRNVAAQNDEGA